MSKILIIEDELDIIKVVKKRLEDNGFSVVVSTDAYQGVKAAHQEKPDLIILDLMLPAGGGLSVLKNLKISVLTSSIPVVVMTGMKDDAYKDKVLAEGVDAFLEKPYDPVQLVEIIKNILCKG